MEDQIPEDVVKDRFNRLLERVQTIAARVCSRHEGTVQDVLVEEVNHQDPSLVTGKMSNNIVVHFKGDASLIGKIVPVHLTSCKNFYYMGESVKNN